MTAILYFIPLNVHSIRYVFSSYQKPPPNNIYKYSFLFLYSSSQQTSQNEAYEGI